jgi:hypothetical protein
VGVHIVVLEMDLHAPFQRRRRSLLAERVERSTGDIRRVPGEFERELSKSLPLMGMVRRRMGARLS